MNLVSRQPDSYHHTMLLADGAGLRDNAYSSRINLLMSGMWTTLLGQVTECHDPLLIHVQLYIHRESAGRLMYKVPVIAISQLTDVSVLLPLSRLLSLPSLCFTTGFALDRSRCSLPDGRCFQCTVQLEVLGRAIFVKELDVGYRHTSFYCDPLYCVSQMLHFLTNWRRKKVTTRFIALLALLQWSGSAPATSSRYACKEFFLYRRCEVQISYFQEVRSAVSTPFVS